jgi:signal transduction histidine kinase
MSRRWADDVRALDRALGIRDEFLSIASHELRTPLTPLQLHVQRMRRQASAEPRAVTAAWLEPKLAVMQRQIDRLTRLVNELLDLGRLERGQLRLAPEPIDFCAVVRESVARFEEVAGPPATGLIHLHAGASITGSCDRLRLEQVIVSLLDNALKYGQSKPIRIDVAPSETGIELAVIDHGIGIPLADCERIFERYGRAVRSTQYGGLGLGLYIARQIVAAMGGTIDVASRPGEETSFTVRLPLETSPSPAGA